MAHISPYSCPGCLGFALGVPWLLWAKVQSLALVGELCPAWSAVSKPWVPAKVSPCVVSPDIAHSEWIWSMLLTTRPNKAKGLPIILRWLLKFGFVLLCLHFYCPLTFHFPFSSVLHHVLPVSLFHLFVNVPVSPVLSSPSLLLPYRAPIVFPFTFPFAEPSHLLWFFIFSSPRTLWRSLPGSLWVACMPLDFTEQL